MTTLGATPFRCAACTSTFSDVRVLRDHWLRNHAPKPIVLDDTTCWFCGARHAQVQLGSDGSWRCERCGLSQ